MANIFSLYGSIFIDNEKANKAIDGTTKKGENFASKLGGVFSKVGKGALALGGTLTTAATAIGGLAINTSKDVDQAMNSFIVQTGIAKNESGEWQKALEDIYKNNYGESFEDIANSMALASQELYEFDPSQIKAVTENALALRDAFGVEVNESIRATKALMTQFGISADEAYNLMAQGAQAGLDFSGELVDNINEYSVQFGKLGLSAEDMFNIFQSGADAGAWNLDKIGDAVKEFSIRAIDGSKTTVEGFTKLGLNADTMAKKFAAGGDTAKEAFYQTIDAIKAMDDPVQQSIVGVDLFGTMWEDLGPEVVTQLGSIREMYDGTVDSMNQIKEVKYDDIGSMFEGLKRNVQMLLLPLGNALMPLIVSIMNLIMNNMPLIEGLINQLTPVITQLFNAIIPSVQTIIETALPMLATLIETILPIFISLLSTLLPPIMQIVEALLPVFVELINMLLPPILQIVQMILPLLLNLIQPLLPLLSPILQLLQPFIDLLMLILQPLTELLNLILPPLVSILNVIIQSIIPMLSAQFTYVANIIGSVFGTAISYITSQIQVAKNIFMNIIDFIKNVFTGNWKAAWQNVKNIFSNIISGIGNIFKLPINFIIDGMNAFIKGLNKLKIPDWVPGVGGKGLNISLIKKLRVGMEYVPYDDMPALLHKGEQVLTADEAKDYRENKNSIVNNNETNNFNLTINSTEPLSPAETARQTRKALQEYNLRHGRA